MKEKLFILDWLWTDYICFTLQQCHLADCTEHYRSYRTELRNSQTWQKHQLLSEVVRAEVKRYKTNRILLPVLCYIHGIHLWGVYEEWCSTELKIARMQFEHPCIFSNVHRNKHWQDCKYYADTLCSMLTKFISEAPVFALKWTAMNSRDSWK